MRPAPVRRWTARGWAVLALLVVPSGSAFGPDVNPVVACLSAKHPSAVWTLPPILREVSDLAVTDDGRLFANNDERGVVVQIDPADGKALKAFSMGPPVVRGDFEGMTIVGPRIFLITSRGALYETREGPDGAFVAFTLTDTQLGSWCEIEGLTHEPNGRTLLILCKTPYAKSLRGAVTAFRWAIDGGLGTPDRITIPLATLVTDQSDGFHGSGISPDPASGNYLMVAGMEHAAAVVTPQGQVLGTVRLKHHPQVEGVAILRDGRILVSDEGGAGPGTISVYACGKSL